MPANLRVRSRPAGGGGGGGGAPTSHGGAVELSINDFMSTIEFDFFDANNIANDAATFLLNIAQADTQAAITDQLDTGVNFGADNIGGLTDAQSFTLRVWLSNTVSGGSGVTNPANANSQNDGAVCVLTSTVGGSASPRITSDIGTSIGSISFSSVLFRGWFSGGTTLVTSNIGIAAHSTTAAFADIQVFLFSVLNGTVNHSSGDFTFDLQAAGVNTLAKLQSLQIIHQTNDAAAGVTPATMSIDAAAVDITGVFS